jgi:YfiH family protein
VNAPPCPDQAIGVELIGSGPTRRLEMPILSSVSGLVHAFTTRGSNPYAVLRERLGGEASLHTLRQVHGTDVRVVGRGVGEPPPDDREEGDALVTDMRGVAVGVWVADCVPILICHEGASVAAAVHAGWRGTVAAVLRTTLRSIRRRFGASPEGLRIAFGPCIGPCCFEVGDEVAAAFLGADAGMRECIVEGERPRIDLVAANRRQARLEGVPEMQMQTSGLCTACRTDLLESHRRAGGVAGRMAGLIAWRS